VITVLSIKMALTGGMTELKKIETLGWIAKIKIL
jgi:hypothetical protein